MEKTDTGTPDIRFIFASKSQRLMVEIRRQYLPNKVRTHTLMRSIQTV